MRARLASALARDTRGATLVEFAFVAPVLCLFLIGGFDIAHSLYMRAVLQGVVQKTARDSALETNTGPTVQDTIDQKITDQVHQLANNATVAISRVAYRTFDAAKKAKAEDYTDTNGDGTCDAGEPYVDANNSGEWEANGGVRGQGGARDKTVYTVTVTYPRMFPLYKYIGVPAQQTLVATTVLQNQPYSDQAAVGTAVLNCP